MRLSEEDLLEFCDIWEHEFGERLTVDEARQRASELLELFLIGIKQSNS